MLALNVSCMRLNFASVFVFLFVMTSQGIAWALSSLQRPAVDVAWFRSEDWSLEVACSVNGCSAAVDVVKPGERGFYTELYTNFLTADQCTIDMQKQEVQCMADRLDLIVGFNQVLGGSLYLVKYDDMAVVQVKDSFGNVVYTSKKNAAFEGCAFHVPENAGYVGTFGSNRYQPFETIIFPDGTNVSACDNRPVKNPIKLTGELKAREIQCVSREYSLSLNVSEPAVDPSAGGAPYAYFKQNVAFEIRARTNLASRELGRILNSPVDMFSISTVQGKLVHYDTSVGVSFLESDDADPYVILPSKWVGQFSGQQVPVIVETKADANYFYVNLQNANEGSEDLYSELKFPLQTCSAM